MLQNLEARFGSQHIQMISFEAKDFYLIDLPQQHGAKLLMTAGLHAHQMPVHEKHQDEAFIELYVFLPSYFELSQNTKEPTAWPLVWLSKLYDYVLEKDTWLGHGHTFPSQLPIPYLMLVRPLALEALLTPIQLPDKTIHFLGLLPLFSDEFDYKQSKGTLKLLQKLVMKGVSEKLDDYRSSVLQSKWQFWKR
jgi:hypothetical protein